jgi:small subunit ribosomal protein S16
VAVKIKLKRLGKIRAPYYRIVVADARTKRDGRAIEEIGKYHPKSDPSFIEVNSERAQHWLSVGAQPTDPVRKLLEITGDWQRYKGLPGTEGTLRTAEPKADKKIAFAEALQETLTDSGATTKGKAKSRTAESAGGKTAKAARPDKAESKADKAEPKAESKTEPKAESKAESAKTESAKAESAKAESPKAEQSDKAAKPAKDSADVTASAETTASADAAAPAAGDAAGDSASSEG